MAESGNGSGQAEALSSGWRSGMCRWGKRLGVGYLVFCAVKGVCYLAFGATLWTYVRNWWNG
jgi:hypothetical protein